jgi:hypothetical protein
MAIQAATARLLAHDKGVVDLIKYLSFLPASEYLEPCLHSFVIVKAKGGAGNSPVLSFL